ncbi:MAG: bifunctional diguanylate cyclase/phosphodiesterase [Aliarcobacter sp.]|jgi:diguanylate cyclase (GGDEF)-like protein|nr:bifunctional diguanylate cyclase/phosphodiesterase [Aliarcobacter sp.]
MRYDISVVDDNIIQFEELKEYSLIKLKNIRFTLFPDINNLNKDLDLTDLLVINIKFIEYFNKIKDSFHEDVFVIFLINNESDLEKISKIKNASKLYNPLNFDKLIIKIEDCVHFLENKPLIKKEEEFSNSIINNINYPIFSTDGYKIIFSNTHFFKLTNCSSLDELNTKYQNIKNIFYNEEHCFTKLNKKWLAKPEINNTKVCILDKDNNKCFFTLQKIFLTHNNTNIIILNDISHEIKHKNELFELLYTDNLTKFPNRTKLIEDLQNNLLQLEAVCLLNINSFKEVNDFFGHKVGDSILIDVAKLINQKIKKHSNLKLFKFPSDNYCITKTKGNKEEFIELIKNIVDSVYKKVFIFENYEIDIRITAGISFSNKNNKLITADIALQSAKKDHKDYLVFFDELDKFQEYENNMHWTKKLKSAFINDNIQVYFQPLVNNKTLKVDKYECLVRLIEENGKVISPYFFLDISKKSNQYKKLTRIVLEKSFKKFEHLPFEFAVNISYEDIESNDFLDFIKEMLNKYNVSNKVVFEILEDESIKNYQYLISFIDEVKALGCKVAIDDFGSGYSNFEHLLKMNVDYLKIDASLIKNVAINETSYKITKTIIEFAKSLNLQTIAEYVENEEIFNIVRELGADYSQGYFFSEPIAIPSVIEFNKKIKK